VLSQRLRRTDDGQVRLTIFRTGVPLRLSDVLPVLQSTFEVQAGQYWVAAGIAERTSSASSAVEASGAVRLARAIACAMRSAKCSSP